jgi:hypothetical protein
VIWLPLLVWKAVMLLWALWLASRVFRWVVDGWSAFSEGGLWKMPPRKAKKEKAPKDPPPDEPTEEPKKAPTGWSPISEGS